MRKTKRGLLALLPLLALSAIGAGSASAAATTTGAQWYTGASPGTTLAAPQAINCALHATPAVLRSEVGSPPQVLEMDATGMECLNATIETKK
jgi:hypothetical protein